MRIQPFIAYASTLVNAIATTTPWKLPTPGTSVRVANLGANVAYIAFGTAAVVATVNSIAILPGSVEVFSVEVDPQGPTGTTGLGPTHIAFISPSGTNLNLVTGEGC